jgi:hypothetical protein
VKERNRTRKEEGEEESSSDCVMRCAVGMLLFSAVFGHIATLVCIFQEYVSVHNIKREKEQGERERWREGERERGR